MPRFPLDKLPRLGFHKGSGKRWFGSSRNEGRKHAACDLLAKPDTPIFAVAPGYILHKGYFYMNTWELTVWHWHYTVRYGEIRKKLPDDLKPGMFVFEGQHIADVGQLSSGSSMLHFEMYKGTSFGKLTQRRNKDYDYVPKANYKRRRDLLDPTPYLEEWALTTPGVF